MKKMKRFVALALSVVMVLAMSVMAFAENGTYSITIKNAATNHTYEAYQIFGGDLSTDNDGNKILSNIVWGDGVTNVGREKLGDAAAKAATLKSEANAASFAKEVAVYLQNPKSSTESNNEYKISGLTPGYYLVKDKDNSLSNKDDYYTAYIMEVVGDVEATPKGDKPSLDKQIKHNEKATDQAWGVVGDNQIGDTVEFRTITTVPDTSRYETYDYIIYDTMSTGLTSNVKTNENVTIKVNDTEILDTKYYTVEVDSSNANKFSIKVDIIKAVEDGKMKVGDSLYSYYTAVLNEDALIYDDGKQDNTAYLEYSNNPNDTKDTGKTPEKKVYDWTFKMGVNKVAGNGSTELTGAKFVLSKNGLLGDLKESDIADNTADLIKLIKNEDGTYTVAPDGTEGTTNTIEAGKVTIKGLDDATTYYLYEIKAPEGYNKLTDPVSFKVTAEYNGTGDEVKEGYPTVTIDSGEPSGILETKVINNAGSSLPSTGGIGTTIFYIVGGILMVGAAVLLITKRRAEN